MKQLDDIIETLRGADNEATDAPYWLIIDPRQMLSPSVSKVGNMIAGPFFSRADAERQLVDKRHRYSDRAKVWCASGHASDKYRDLCHSAAEAAERIGR